MTTQAIPIHDGQDFYVPSFEVRVQGRTLDRGVVRDILQVTYKDSLDQIDSFEISINNWDAARRTYKYSDEHLFDPGRQVELRMGYFGGAGLRLMLTGEITSLRPSFPASGPSTLAVSGLNVLHRLRRKQESCAYENLTDSQIARRIGARLNVRMITDEDADELETPYPYLFQNNQYDIVYLMQRARRIGYDLFAVERDQGGQTSEAAVYFGRSHAIQRVTYRLHYGSIEGRGDDLRFPSMIQFQPDLTTANQVGEVTVRGWDAVRKRKIEATATRRDLATRGVGRRADQRVIEQSFNQRKEIIATRPIASEQEARRMAIETLEQIAKDMIKGSGSTVGLPDLRAGSVLMIGGLGERFSGRYFVTGTTHTIGDNGYTTQFECRREELNEQA
jgi:uncharacterized protein